MRHILSLETDFQILDYRLENFQDFHIKET